MRRVAAIMCLPILMVGCGGIGPSESPGPSMPRGSVVSTPSSCPGCAPSPSPSRPGSTPSPTVSTLPATDTWIPAGEFNDYRVVTELALLGTGEVLAAGHEPACGIESAGSDTAELWDPRSGRWSWTDRLPSPRNAMDLIALADGRSLVTGGANAEYVAKSSTVVFDPVARRWSSAGLLNTARMGFASAALPDGHVLVAGGRLTDKSYEGRALNSAEVWDPETGAWTQVRPMSAVRDRAVAATLADGRVLVVGGAPSGGADVDLSTAEIFDSEAGRWTPAGELSAPRREFALVALPDGGALVIGGVNFETVVEDGETYYPASPTAAAERFDPATATWSTVEGWEPASGRRPAAVAMRDGRILIVDGATTAVYDPDSAVWTPTVPIPGDRYDGSAVLLQDGSVLVAGGSSDLGNPEDTPNCPAPSPQAWRFVPGS